ncbi:MAG: RDD family protein [Akkermansiaceae bacterium]|nr:RDD family protein [Akkermansiaceae bacterium]
MLPCEDYPNGIISLIAAIPIWGGLFLIGVVKSVKGMGSIGYGSTVVITVLSYALFIAIQWTSLIQTGQTIGKKVVKTRIVTMDGRKPSIQDLLVKKYGFMNAVGLIPVVGALISLLQVCLIFKRDRRCLHDTIAGTQVMKVS